jgi:ubiquinone/menaquinone biosynthesis C-methylase UbiE
VNQSDLVALLQDGVTERGGRWADLGAGEGAFTFALAELLGPGAHITVVDKDGRALRSLGVEMGRRYPGVTLEAKTGDFTRDLGLSVLDGVVMANSLHFVRDKAPVLDSVRAMLRPGGSLIVVEYGTDQGNPWVPHAFSYASWEKLAARAGFARTRLLRTIPSRYFGSMYSAVSENPLAREGRGAESSHPLSP